MKHFKVSEIRCEICGEKAVARCKLCGRYVCERHYDRSTGLCSICLRSRCEICNQRLALSRCIICGRLICDKCSIQLDSVRRICLDCLNKLFHNNVNLAREFVSQRRYYRIPQSPKRVTIKVIERLGEK